MNTDADFIRMVEEIQRGENVNENLKVLTEAFKGVVIAAAQKSGRRQEIADIINDAPFFVYKAALSYDPNRGASFATYLANKVGWFIGHEWQKRHDRIERKGKKTKWVPRVFVPVQDFDFISDTDSNPNSNDPAALERAVRQLAEIRDRRLFAALLSEGNARAAAKKLRKSYGVVYNRIKKIHPVLAAIYELEKERDNGDPFIFPGYKIESVPLPK